MANFCPNCGEDITEKVKFCPKCGADIDSFLKKSVEKEEKEENKKDVKIEDKKTEKKYNPSQIAIRGIIIVGILILIIAAALWFFTFSNAMQSNIHSSPKITPASANITLEIIPSATQTPIVTQTLIVTPIPTVASPSPMTIRIPVLPATRLSNEPSVAVKAQYSTPTSAKNFANEQASKNQMRGVPTQQTRPLIKTFISPSRHDSVLQLTNRDTDSHVYYVEVNFYEEDVQLSSTNGFAWYVPSGQSVLAEIIPPERATSYIIKNVDMVTTSGYYSTGYDLVQE